jgi:hypothetical protein
MNLPPGKLLLSRNRSTVFIFRLYVNRVSVGTIAPCHFDLYSTIHSLHSLHFAVEDSALLERSPNAQRRCFPKDHSFTGRHVLWMAYHREQHTGSRFLHPNRLGKHIHCTHSKQYLIDIADRLWVEIVDLRF